MQQDTGTYEIIDAGQRLRLTEPPTSLRRVTIEITTWCNLECAGCIRTIATKAGSWKNRHMAPEVFARIVEHLPPTKLGILHGIGEPTMHPDFLELVSIARNSGKFARLHCNTNVLARNVDFYLQMVERGISHFSVSVDTLNPELIQVTRTGTDIGKLLTRLKMFNERKLGFNIQMVVSKHNRDDIFLTLHQLNNLGKTTVFIQPYINHDDRDFALDESMARFFLDRLNNLKPIFGNLTVVAGGFRSLGVDDGHAELPLCTSPWLDPGVSVEGFLTPCCVHLNSDALGRLNLAEKSFVEAWRSDGMRNFMSAYVQRAPDFCATCSENVRMTPRSKLVSKIVSKTGVGLDG